MTWQEALIKAGFELKPGYILANGVPRVKITDTCDSCQYNHDGECDPPMGECPLEHEPVNYGTHDLDPTNLRDVPPEEY